MTAHLIQVCQHHAAQMVTVTVKAAAGRTPSLV